MSVDTGGYRCPDCGRSCESASALTDHSLTEHVQADTPAGHIRRPRRTGLAKAIAVIGVLLGIALWTTVVLAAVGVFDKATVPETPESVVHEMAVELRGSGDIDDFRAVEPADGWDTEYEIDDGEGVLRIRDEGTRGEELEYEAIFSDDLEEDLERVIRDRGFLIEE